MVRDQRQTDRHRVDACRTQPPFVDGGDPAFGLLQSAKAQGETLSEFPFAGDGYVIHRGRSSLFTV
ncbi:MAG: hypothetical protein ABSA02_39310 [Trebonia sp.]|jgi:hypothetical protein